VCVPVWLAWSLPDGGSVRVCRARPGCGAAQYGREWSTTIDEYAVILDAGTWIWPVTDDWGVAMRPANAVDCG